ncbi:c-type cytochrome [Novosphingobium terrae]|uniref:c-type cytochrome n=1 Tax=Novosphingobium terrae TaxID=2726189 RepID=UPI00197D4EE7|nr:c-type cytochrome [Novosphingobium terrae]
MLKFVVPVLALGAMASGAQAAGDAKAGAALVKARCQMCHVLAKGQKPTPMAPNLSGVVGRKAGSSDYAQYSAALKGANITWTPARLDAFLQAPGKLVPGTKMVIAVPDAAQRADVIAFLVSNK